VKVGHSPAVEADRTYGKEQRKMDSAQRMDSAYDTDIAGTGWLGFAGIMLILVGFFNVIDGIAAIANSNYLANQLLFANMDAWGWFFLIWGIIQIVAGVAVLRGERWAVIVGIATSFVNAIAELASSKTFPVWSLALIAGNVLAIYGLVRYGGTRRRSPARS
jgi:hypothetical protein